MNLRHFLDFKDTIGRIEISEPFGFDGSTHKVEQSDSYGRDVVLGDEEIELVITKSHFEKLPESQQLPNGVQFDYASQGFDYFIDVLKNEGWEAEIEYILEKDGTEFSKGIIDGLTCQIEFQEVKFKVIQNTQRELIKRRLDVNINAFSDKDLDGNDIEPCQTANLLLKAKPIQQISEWRNNVDSIVFSVGSPLFPGWFNKIKSVTTFGIENTLSWFDDYYQGDDWNEISNFRIVEAQTQLTDIVCSLQLKMKFEHIQDGLPNDLQVAGYIFKGTPATIEFEFTNNAQPFYITPVINNANPIVNIDQTFTVNIPVVEQGEMIFFVFLHLSNGNDVCKNTFFESALTITSTSTSIDTISKGVRYIDLLKHACKSVGISNVVCPQYDTHGLEYDNFALNGYLIGQITDKPFNNKLKDLLQVTKELNHGYQINPNNIEVLHFDEFYKNNEIGAFVEVPNLTDGTNQDINFALKTFEFNYRNSSKGRETNSEGSIDDVHGQTQWLFPSKKTDKNLSIELDHIRSAFLIEEQRRRSFDRENTTSLQGDDKLYLIKTVPLSPSSLGGFTASLQMQVNSTVLKILSNNFSWDLLGFNVGSTFKILSGQNVGNYTVTTIESNVLTLFGTSASFNGTATITVSYPLNGVLLTNQTNEGYAQIEGIANETNYSNLDYSIGRNLKHWYSYLGVAGRYLSGLITNTLFEVNGNLATRKTGETELLKDSDPIDLLEIKEMRLIEPRIEKVSVFTDFDGITEICQKVATEKGYIRVQKTNNKVILGYPKEMEYSWSTGELEMKLQPKKESEFYEVDVNLLASFQINNNLFVSLYDTNDILLVTPLRFDKIKVNGIVYTNEIALSDALIELIQS
jgi:hypothetical protein